MLVDGCLPGSAECIEIERAGNAEHVLYDAYASVSVTGRIE
jgi:hypothetical protein